MSSTMWAGLAEKEDLGRREAKKAVPTRAEAAGRMRWCHDIGGIWGRKRMGVEKQLSVPWVKNPVRQREEVLVFAILAQCLGAEMETRVMFGSKTTNSGTIQTRKNSCTAIESGSCAPGFVLNEASDGCTYLRVMNLKIFL